MREWYVRLFAEEPNGKWHFVAAGKFWADTEQDAEECALQAWWGLHMGDLKPRTMIEEVCMAPIEKFLDKVRRILAVVDEGHAQRDWFGMEDAFRDFISTANPNFPSDTCDLLDIAQVFRCSHSLPSGKEIRLLEMSWNGAWGWSGTLRWKYRHPILTLGYSPKKTGAYYEVTFRPAGVHPLSFPLHVTFVAYADMDRKENHSDSCPVYYIEEHEDDCPCKALLEAEDFDEARWQEAEKNCYCGPDDCHCEPASRTASKEFTSTGGFIPTLTEWLAEMIHKE